VICNPSPLLARDDYAERRIGHLLEAAQALELRRGDRRFCHFGRARVARIGVLRLVQRLAHLVLLGAMSPGFPTRNALARAMRALTVGISAIEDVALRRTRERSVELDSGYTWST